ncbi:uncharacterized protein A4U43_C01F17000 [Asparagus officinalis]|uniref:Uncharacterized protein n=1 Tax=Asparagus officinalis TaxID=4686 RepID=A0A5P1FPY9_ASPOF|nr:uncharacterized protein A4U43_C01F17000 [Asparagus officinalis]
MISEVAELKNKSDKTSGVAWTEEEHKMFLLGLRKLGKGDWRGIARNFVVSRTSTQVASHAQKYFIRQMNVHKRKKRTSLFDLMPNELEAQNSNPAAAPLPLLEAEHESTSSNSNNPVPAPSPGEVERAIPKPGTMPLPYVVVPCSPFFPFSYPMWGCYGADVMANSMHSVVKPTAVHSAVPINVGDVPSISKLSLGGEPAGQMSFGSSERISAFHRNNPTNGSGSSSSPIQAA